MHFTQFRLLAKPPESGMHIGSLGGVGWLGTERSFPPDLEIDIGVRACVRACERFRDPLFSRPARQDEEEGRADIREKKGGNAVDEEFMTDAGTEPLAVVDALSHHAAAQAEKLSSHHLIILPSIYLGGLLLCPRLYPSAIPVLLLHSYGCCRSARTGAGAEQEAVTCRD